MLQRSLQDALTCLENPEYIGARAHAHGSANVPISVLQNQFLTNLDAAVAASASALLDPASIKQYDSATANVTLGIIKQCTKELQLWCVKSPDASLAFFRRAAEAAGFQVTEDTDSVSASSDTLLVDVTKRSFEVQISVFAGSVMKAKLEVEAKELSQAISTADLREMHHILQGITLKARNLLRQTHQPEPPSISAGRGWGGARGVLMHVFRAGDIESPDRVKCWLNYEIPDQDPKGPKYVIKVEPPIPMPVSLASRVTHGDFSTFDFPARELSALVYTSTNQQKPTAVIDFSTPSTGASVALYTIVDNELLFDEGSQLAETSGAARAAPLVGRLESNNLGELEIVAGDWIRRQYHLNELLNSCFRQTAKADESGQSSDLAILFSVKIDGYQRGLLLHVQADGFAMDVFIDVAALAAEDVEITSKEDSLSISQNLSDLAAMMTTILKKSFNIPAMLHFGVATLFGSGGRQAKKVRFDQGL